MKVSPLDRLVEAKKYVVKRNPWYTMWMNGQVAYMKKAPSEEITAKVPPWAKSRYGLAARPEGVKWVDDISAFIWKTLGSMGHIHPGFKTAITEKVWARISSAVESGATPTEDEVRAWINEAIDEVARERGTTREAILNSGNKKYEMLEKRSKRRAGLKALASRLVPALR